MLGIGNAMRKFSFGDDLFLGWSPEEIGIYDF